MRLLQVGSSQKGCTTDRARVLRGENRSGRGVSATARKFAQPGRDGLLVAQRLAAPGGARLAGADRVPLRGATGPGESGLGWLGRGGAAITWLPLGVISDRHRATSYKTHRGLSTPNRQINDHLPCLTGQAG